MNIKKLALIAIILIVASPIFFFLFRKTVPIINRIIGMPDISILEDYQPIGSIEIYDYKDNFVGVLQGKEDRQVVKLEYISDYLKKAVLAIEDSDFYHHSGFSFNGLFRAFMTNMMAGRIVQGGSTITQQLVKNLFIKEDERYQRSYLRKVRELLIALEVEDRYPKDRILEIYLNQVYFGNRAYGIERASQRYFSKSASKLNLEEGAFLGGLLTAPSYLADNHDKAMERQKKVLERMLENGYITKEEYNEVIEKPIVFKKSAGNFSKFPYYFSYVEQELKKRFTRNELKQTGLKVYTGLDPLAQRLAKQSLDIGIKNAAHGINQGALVTIDVETGEVRALVGGVGDFWQNQYNRAINVHTIGSGFKPFVYLTAFMKGVVGPDSIIEDKKLELEDLSAENMIWAPKNFDEEFHGPITVRAALVFSRNIPAVKVAMKTGLHNIIDTARKAGITSPMEAVPSLALGSVALSPLEVANAYATLARGGVHMNSVLIRKITDSRGNVLEINQAKPKTALPEKDVSLLVNIMRDVVRFGTGALANIPERVIAGKTGTADGNRDTWFTGFTPDYVTTVWAGNEHNREVLSRHATGGGTPAWVWHEYMTAYYLESPKPIRTFSFSDDYVTVSIDPLTGLLATEYTPDPVQKRYALGTQPKRYAPVPDLDKIYTRKERKSRTFLKIGKEDISEEDKRIRVIESEDEYDDEIKFESTVSEEQREKHKKKIQAQPKLFTIDQEFVQNETILDEVN